MPFPAVNAALERALVARDYAEPTAVQLAVLETEASGRDMLVSAQTGSGKTVAFGLALARGLLGDAERFERAAEPMALIIAPTRELAVQVQRELTWLYAGTGARIASCVGGMDPKAERIALGEGAHIVVGTPGRLRDHLERRRLDVSKLRAVVLDEADEMLDLGFRDDLQFILDQTPAERQTLMFSATVPREIETLARSYQRNAIRIETAVRNQQHDDIEYRAVRTVPYAIEPTVVNLLRYHDARATLVFCATREGVRRLHQGLVGRGFSAVALSGELSQAERTEALQALRDGRARVLVATDVAARGLDLAELTLVIHADLPNDRETMLHRSGRTGRAGRKGISILVVPPNKRKRAEELLGRSKIDVTWGNAPTAKEIAEKDQERLLAMPILDELATAEDLALGRMLLDGRTAEQVAAALIRMHRAGLPVAENLKDLGRPAGAASHSAERTQHQYPKKDRHGSDHERPAYQKSGYQKREAPVGRGNYGERDEAPRMARSEQHLASSNGAGFDRPDRKQGRKETGPMVWFGLNIGREKNADPRWLLPLICRVGEVSKSEIGSIRISDAESKFEIQAEHADRFAAAVEASNNKEGKIWRLGAGGSSSEAAPRPPAVREERSARSVPAEHVEPVVKAEGAAPSSAPNGGSGYVKRKHPAASPTGGKRDHARPEYARPERADGAAAKPAAGTGYLKRKPATESAATGGGNREHARPEHTRPERADGAGKKPYHAQSRFKPDTRKPRHEGTLHSGKPAGNASGKPSGGKPGGFRAFKAAGKTKRHP